MSLMQIDTFNLFHVTIVSALLSQQMLTNVLQRALQVLANQLAAAACVVLTDNQVPAFPQAKCKQQ